MSSLFQLNLRHGSAYREMTFDVIAWNTQYEEGDSV